MAKEKKIKWPPPPERDALQQYLGQEAGRLLAEYRRVKSKKGGAGTGRQRWMIRGAALDLLRATEAPSRLIELFDVMLGGVSTELSGMREPWLDLIVDIEARIYQFEDRREVSNSELVRAAMDSGLLPMSRNHAMRKVREARRQDWYSALIHCRCIYLVDNPETA